MISHCSQCGANLVGFVALDAQGHLICRQCGYDSGFVASAFWGTLQSASKIRYDDKPLPTGHKVEDLIGWRIWRVTSAGELCSIATPDVWLPGEPMTGRPTDHGPEGVWAFKDRKDAERKARSAGPSYAYGSVRLWGEVIEHRLGYRAANARILTIDGVIGVVNRVALEGLRRRYGVSGDAEALAPIRGVIEMPEDWRVAAHLVKVHKHNTRKIAWARYVSVEAVVAVFFLFCWCFLPPLIWRIWR